MIRVADEIGQVVLLAWSASQKQEKLAGAPRRAWNSIQARLGIVFFRMLLLVLMLETESPQNQVRRFRDVNE